MWFIGVEVEQETSTPPPKKNPGSAPATGFTRVHLPTNRLPPFVAPFVGTSGKALSYEERQEEAVFAGQLPRLIDQHC